ncbi:hypothetical protein KC19_11G078200 [Ceratodon purpureus]|uniref:Uncharacterized protein n=1 Tax=Ceratodon purpureus TaxID=3225 RepID=A0A8T0GDJ7_CERPU|nr:hypothetical protein KC19_11G078200 [Ceratodon purpureus]
MSKLFACWLSGAVRPNQANQASQSLNNAAVLIQAINQAASHFSGQLNLNEQVERARAFNTVKLLQDSILDPEEEEDFTPGLKHQRPASPLDYTLDIDYTAAKVVNSVIEKCKLFLLVTSLYNDGCHELLIILQGLHNILTVVQGSACLDRYKDVLEEILLYSTKAFAFIDKVYLQAMPNTLQLVPGCKTSAKFSEFACRFYNLKVELYEQYERSDNDILLCVSPREERLSYGVTTYSVPLHNLARRLYKKKRVVIPLTEVNGKSRYEVELTYPRTWRSDNVGLTSRVESSDHGYSKTLQGERVQIEKGGWGWEAAQDTVLITYDDLLVANVASIAGSLLTFNKDGVKDDKTCSMQTFRTSIQVVGSSRIDSDLQNLFVKGTKDKDNVYLKCFVTTDGEEVLAIYRYHRQHFHRAEGLLHIIGRGNQPGLRHVLISIFSSLGFTSVV